MKPLVCPQTHQFVLRLSTLKAKLLIAGDLKKLGWPWEKAVVFFGTKFADAFLFTPARMACALE